MFANNHNYTILVAYTGQNSNSIWNVDRKLLVVISFLMLPVILFCVSYMLVFGLHQTVIYPKNTLKYVPEQSIHRALIYNVLKNETRKHDLRLHTHRPVGLEKFKIVCYYNFRANSDSLQVDELNPSLCTHINAGFASVLNNTIYLEQTNRDELKKVTALKRVNNDLKVLLTVGGAGGTGEFAAMVLNHANRKSFIRSFLSFVKDYDVDGVDLDWEFPNEEHGTDKLQRMHFTQLLEELRKSSNRQPKPFLISVAVAAPDFIVETAYDVSYMNEYVDYVNLMTYDFHYYTQTTPFTGINSPLFATNNEKFYLSQMNINYSSHLWNILGMDRSKILVGLPTYAHTFKLVNPKNNGTYAPASGYGKLGSKGFADYNQVCQFLSVNQISPVFDMDTRSPYAFKQTEWVSFDNTQSLTYKAEFIKDNGFGGAMVYSLNSDDYRGVCRSGKFPLTQSIRSVLHGTN